MFYLQFRRYEAMKAQRTSTPTRDTLHVPRKSQSSHAQQHDQDSDPPRTAVPPSGSHATRQGAQHIQKWPSESREATQLVIDQYGEPDEATETQLVWHKRGPWKRIVATKTFFRHNFPAPHIDAIESVIDYRVPVDKFTALAEFDGSVVVERTAGEVSARCHDEQANFLALNLMHDIATGAKSVKEAREYYAKEFADYRRKRPTPYMERLRFTPEDGNTADLDTRMLSDADLEKAVEEGKKRAK
jgi:hypothetical protein